MGERLTATVKLDRALFRREVGTFMGLRVLSDPFTDPNTIVFEHSDGRVVVFDIPTPNDQPR